MFKTTLIATLTTIAAITSFAVNCQAQWVDYESMINQGMNNMNNIVGQAQSNVNQIVQQNMNNPQIQQMFRSYQSQGGPMSFQQYCYYYAATAGGQNVVGYVNNEHQIAQNEANAMKNYQNHVNNLWADTNAYRNEVNDRIAYQRGELLSGNTYYSNPNTGGQVQLPYTAAAGQTYTDYYGNTYTMGSNGNYTYGSNGYNYEMAPVWGR